MVETSYFTPPYGFYDTLETIKSKGMYPIIAHPERYIYMSEDDYACLRSMGVLFQLNLFSLAGLYGRRAKKVAELLLKKVIMISLEPTSTRSASLTAVWRLR